MGKTRPLFDEPFKIIVSPQDQNASKLYLLVEKFKKELAAIEQGYRYSLGAGVWNYANLYGMVPQKTLDKVTPETLYEELGKETFISMVRWKQEMFPEELDYIDDIWFEETEKGILLRVEIIDLDSMMEEEENDIDMDLLEDMEEIMAASGEEEEPGYINRSAVIVKYAPPFIEWLNKLKGIVVEKDEFDKEANVYLIDDHIDPEEWVKIEHSSIFESELYEWSTDARSWPRKRSFEKFMEWFDVRFIEDVYDLGTDPVRKYI